MNRLRQFRLEGGNKQRSRRPVRGASASCARERQCWSTTKRLTLYPRAAPKKQGDRFQDFNAAVRGSAILNYVLDIRVVLLDDAPKGELQEWRLI